MDGHAQGSEPLETFSNFDTEGARRSLLILMSHLEEDAGNRDARRQLEDLELAINRAKAMEHRARP